MGTTAGFSQRRQIAGADAEAENRRLHVARSEYRERGLPGELRSISLVGIRSAARTGDRRGNLNARKGALKIQYKKSSRLHYTSQNCRDLSRDCQTLRRCNFQCRTCCAFVFRTTDNTAGTINLALTGTLMPAAHAVR